MSSSQETSGQAGAVGVLGLQAGEDVKPNQALQLIGDDADRIAEIEAENIRLREALAQGSRLVGDEGEGAAWHERWASLRPQGDSNVAG